MMPLVLQACATAADVHTQQWVCTVQVWPGACTFLATPHHESIQTHSYTGQEHIVKNDIDDSHGSFL